MARSKKKARLEKSSPQPEEEDEAEEENGFQVEYFKAARVSDASEWEYFVKWFGYDDPDDDTWEPQENIASCQRLLASFWKEVGTDNKDYPPGYECYPSDTWIKKEKAWFLAHSDDEKKKKRIAQQKAREAEQAKKEAKKKKKEANSANVAKITMAKRAPRASSSASAEVRVKKESDKSNTATALGKRRRSKSESSSESDTPLQKTEKQRSNPKQKKKKNTTPLAPKDDTKTAPPAQDPASLFSDEKSVTVAASLFGDEKS
ncbi:hypothetical protein BT96DRAFT_563991 [Gymnopus androsaceus JB14]|uniref:Chromo domain-containing protein n=1 Tax=Gymnopus androsaceus JB14 TaxID=1447944 RepID=A0A6A4HYG2_9AGAR|nr:hypothetical protein BT96DRAFT_563991 [Gymnopus androsaceus JB14]